MKRNSGVSLLGFLLIVAVGAVTLCGLLYIGKKALSAARTVQAQRDGALTNELTLDKMSLPEELWLDVPGAVWTELNDGLWRVDIPDEQFEAALADYREWAILFSSYADGPWIDTGTRQWGNEHFIRGVLYDLVAYEGPRAIYGSHGMDEPVMQGFYKAIPAEEVVITPTPEDK